MGGVGGRCAALAVACCVGLACATRLPPRPIGAGLPAPEVIARVETLTRHCSGVRTLTAELALSGRAGDDRLRGRVITGLERGGAARLEGVAPFGAPIFILAARAERATLLLPRERRVLQDVPVADVIQRLTGLPLGADDLLQTLTGCVGTGELTAPRQWSDGWAAVEAPGPRTVLLRRQSDAWRLAAVDGGGWRADYGTVQGDIPRDVRLRSEDGRVDLTASVQQLEVNTGIDAAAFQVSVPPGTTPMTLDELRSVAPLRTP
jgi:hypothetical protein